MTKEQNEYKEMKTLLRFISQHIYCFVDEIGHKLFKVDYNSVNYMLNIQIINNFNEGKVYSNVYIFHNSEQIQDTIKFLKELFGI